MRVLKSPDRLEVWRDEIRCEWNYKNYALNPRDAYRLRSGKSSSRRYPGDVGGVSGGYDTYAVSHSTSNISTISYSPPDARRRTSTDGIPNVGNGSLPWEHLPSIVATVPPPMPDQWMTGQVESADSRKQYDAWQTRTGSGGVAMDGGVPSRFNLHPSTDYPPSYSASPSSFGDSGGRSSTSNGELGEVSPSTANRASPPPPRPYSCDICGFAFARNHDLTRHVRGHEPAQFGCERCGKAYTRLDSLRRHYVRKRCGPNYMAA